MKIKRIYGLCALVLAAIVGGTSSAVWTASASALSSPQTFSLLEVSIPKNDRPLGDFTFNRPPVGGDQFTVTDALYKWAGTKRGARAGHVEVLHTFVTGFGSHFTHKAIVLFVAQMYLHGGTLLVQGYGQLNSSGPPKFTLPVVGGTGIYDGACGYVTVRALGNGNTDTTNVDVHLLP